MRPVSATESMTPPNGALIPGSAKEPACNVPLMPSNRADKVPTANGPAGSGSETARPSMVVTAWPAWPSVMRTSSCLAVTSTGAVAPKRTCCAPCRTISSSAG